MGIEDGAAIKEKYQQSLDISLDARKTSKCFDDDGRSKRTGNITLAPSPILISIWLLRLNFKLCPSCPQLFVQLQLYHFSKSHTIKSTETLGTPHGICMDKTAFRSSATMKSEKKNISSDICRSWFVYTVPYFVIRIFFCIFWTAGIMCLCSPKAGFKERTYLQLEGGTHYVCAHQC